MWSFRSCDRAAGIISAAFGWTMPAEWNLQDVTVDQLVGWINDKYHKKVDFSPKMKRLTLRRHDGLIIRLQEHSFSAEYVWVFVGHA